MATPLRAHRCPICHSRSVDESSWHHLTRRHWRDLLLLLVLATWLATLVVGLFVDDGPTGQF